MPSLSYKAKFTGAYHKPKIPETEISVEIEMERNFPKNPFLNCGLLQRYSSFSVRNFLIISTVSQFPIINDNLLFRLVC